MVFIVLFLVFLCMDNRVDDVFSLGEFFNWKSALEKFKRYELFKFYLSFLKVEVVKGSYREDIW